MELIDVLSLLFILIALIEFVFAYKIISKSDPFAFLPLISIRLFFDYFLRPFVFIFLEDYQGLYNGLLDPNVVVGGVIPSDDMPIITLFTIVVNDIAFAFVLLGAYFYTRRKGASSFSKVNTVFRNKHLNIGIIVLILGMFFWLFIMNSTGGFYNAILSLGDRHYSWAVYGSKIPLELAKSFIFSS